MADNVGYRQWLQSGVNGNYQISSDNPNNIRDMGTLLQVVGDDGKVNGNFLADPYSYTGAGSTDKTPQTGHIVSASDPNFGYGPQAISSINNTYYGLYQNPIRASQQATKLAAKTTTTVLL